MNKERIKELALANGFKLKEQPDGALDLNPYVYKFAAALKAQWQAEAITEFVNTVVFLDEKTASDSDYMWDVGDVKDFSVEYIQRLQEAGDE